MLVIHALSSIALVAALSTLQMSEPAGRIYSSEEEAVTAAVNQYNPTSIDEDREFMGAIYQLETGFQFSVISGRRRSDQIKMRVVVSELEDIVAFWHTHGNGDPKNRYFSDTDTQLAEQFSKPLYLGDYTGYLKVFEPNDNTLTAFAASRLGLPRARGYALGKLVEDKTKRPIRVNTRALC